MLALRNRTSPGPGLLGNSPCRVLQSPHFASRRRLSSRMPKGLLSTIPWSTVLFWAPALEIRLLATPSSMRPSSATYAVLFGGCYNHLDVDAFVTYVGQQEWKAREDVQILFWGDNDSKCSVLGFTRRRAARGKSRRIKKRRRQRRKQS